MEQIAPAYPRPSNARLPAALAGVIALGIATGAPQHARAQASPPEQTGMPGNPAVVPNLAAAPGPGGWASSIKLGFQGQAGITVNTLSPASRRNFGQLFNDNANRPILNQLLLTASRDVDPKSTGVDVGFKLQLMYGSDARIVHTMGVFDQLIHDRNQLDIVEANVTMRFPNLFKNGLDVKAGIYPTPLGVELIDPKGNAFYSHSYIFNYGLPYKHTGFLATAHVSDTVDLYFGINTGVNTFLAYGAGDNNNRPGGTAGIGFNFLEGKLTVLALTHIGPENSKRNTPFANEALRFMNDVVVVYKATDKLTLTGEANYIREDGFRAEGWGLTGYASYALTDTLTLNGRAEIWRDNNNFFVSTPVAERDYVNFERGTFSRFITASRPTTYSELTLGVTYKPTGLPSPLSTAMIRPEIRYDRALNNARPFGDGNRSGVVTLAADVVLGF